MSRSAARDASHARPRIGIPLCLDDRGRWRKGRDYLYADLAYARALDAAGGSAVMLPIQAESNALLDAIDGLLLPGGDDFAPNDPGRYPAKVAFDLAPQAQIDFDTALLRGALERGLPILGICYGMQLLALDQGGSLHYHLPHDLPRADSHRLAQADARHAIRAEPGSRIAALIGAQGLVNSLHHQAVAEPGDALRASAWSNDGVIEAIEAADTSRFLLGVQWHPEKLSALEGAGSALFRGLVAAAQKV